MSYNIIYKQKYIIKNNKVIKKNKLCFKCGTSYNIIPSGFCVDCQTEKNDAEFYYNIEREAYLEQIKNDLIYTTNKF